MPSRFPNILVNGTTGIAVGMATNIPPHNLREVIGACVRMIENRVNEDRDTDVEELLDIVKAPDFPTGGIILGTKGAEAAYRTGRGKVICRAVTDIETMENGKNRIVVTELPYLVNKAMLIQKIAEMVKDKRIDGITALRDESDREGMRIVIELRHDANPNVILNRLYKHTQLQDSFGIIMLALVNGEPKVLGLKEMLKTYLAHQEDVVRRRTEFDLAKAKERDHILQGLLIALDNIDEVIRIIRGSANVQEAKTELMARFGLTDIQAQAIVDMRLRALTGLEREKLEAEHAALVKEIERLTAILADRKLLLGVIKDEMLAISEQYGDDRRSRIERDESEADIVDEDLIPNENTVIAMTSLGYIKRMSVDNFHSQGRGGRGVKGMATIDNDYIEDLLMTQTHSWVMFFTSTGRCYRLKAYEIPEGSRNSRGVAIVNILQLAAGEKITAIIPVKGLDEYKCLFMVTKKGVVKKTPINEFANVRKNGLNAIHLREDDELIEVKTTRPDQEVFLVTKSGMCIRFNEKDVRPMGRTASGVRGMNLDPDDEIVGMQKESQGSSLLMVTENGYGKRTNLDNFKLQKRGGKGLICFKTSDKTGDLMGIKAVNDDHEIMIITTGGVLIQIRMADVNVYSRYASGVRLIRLDEGVKVAQIAKVREKVSDPETDTEQDPADDEENNENTDQ